jgi:hypothetical protein
MADVDTSPADGCERCGSSSPGSVSAADYNRLRQNSPLKPSESCLRPLAL